MKRLQRYLFALLMLFQLLSPKSIIYGNVSPAIDVIIDPGHGGIDSGATYDQVEEKHINLSVAKLLTDQLNRRGYHVILSRERDEALSDSSRRLDIRSRHKRDLVQRGEIARFIHPKIFISLHVNAGSATQKGATVLYQLDGQSYLLAHILQNHLNRMTGVLGVPVKGKYFYLLNQVDSPTVIVEMGYISNAEERVLLQTREYQTKLAEAIAAGIEEFSLIYPWSLHKMNSFSQE
jgi:N-acetylmuramoyl-L-alanine amidase